MQTPQPFLMFSGANYARVQEAVDLYLQAFPEASIQSISYDHTASESKGKKVVSMVVLKIKELEIRMIDSAYDHQFNFTPSQSFFITCDSLEEFERLHYHLSEDGKELMAPGSYGFSARFTWFNDKFGVSWQINLP
ncbi:MULTISPECIES: VOC family protein [unclassified Paraflavitalea]|uniref:VOC family protein n=1 Tax=unclassified Paraflavitalea TaxID=2798305 RepID=UPI003D34FE4C